MIKRIRRRRKKIEFLRTGETGDGGCMCGKERRWEREKMEPETKIVTSV